MSIYAKSISTMSIPVGAALVAAPLRRLGIEPVSSIKVSQPVGNSQQGHPS